MQNLVYQSMGSAAFPSFPTQTPDSAFTRTYLSLLPVPDSDFLAALRRVNGPASAISGVLRRGQGQVHILWLLALKPYAPAAATA